MSYVGVPTYVVGVKIELHHRETYESTNYYKPLIIN